MFEVIFFDLFFTLVSTYDNEEEKVHECSVANIDRKLWTNISMSQMYDRSIGAVNTPIGIVRNIMDVINPDASDETIKEVTRLRIDRFKSTVIDVNYENLVALRNIKQLGKKLCLISNADVIDVIGWKDSPLKDLFDEVIFSCEVGIAKPDRRIYEYAMQKLNVKASQCIFVGDGGSDELRGAQESDITTVLTTQYRGTLWPETIEALEQYADYKIGHLDELLKII